MMTAMIIGSRIAMARLIRTMTGSKAASMQVRPNGDPSNPPKP